uniref:Endogenous retrovirus group 48 member 1, envelope n=1 Tax=Cercocebus atys TaxID=9531 RepID=A0A2K5LU04_CERAT
MACTYPTCYTSLPPKSLNTGISLTTILILSVAVLLSAAAPPSCRECYQSFHYRGKIQQSFTYHTHIERSCYGTLIEECVESGKSYYKVKNPGVSGSRNGAICPQGKQWLSKAKASKPTTPPENHPRYFHSFIRKLQADASLPKPGKYLFVDLGEPSRLP